MKIRPRVLALTLAFGLAGLGLAGCATDNVAAGDVTLDTGSYYYADPFYSYDYDWWPYWSYGWRGHRHFVHERSHVFAHSGHGFGRHR